MAVFIHDSHYIWLKVPSKKNYNESITAYQKTEMKLKEEQLTSDEFNCKFQLRTLQEQIRGVWIWDCEAYRNVGDKFIPYSCACIPLAFLLRADGTIHDDYTMKTRITKIKVFEGEDCITQMINYIDSVTPQQKLTKKDKDGQTQE
jgi:hypothetical protein